MGKGLGLPCCPLLLFLGGEKDEQWRAERLWLSVGYTPACAWLWKRRVQSQVPSLCPHKPILSTPLPSVPGLNAIMSLNGPGFFQSFLQITKLSAALRQGAPDRRGCPICREEDTRAAMGPLQPCPVSRASLPGNRVKRWTMENRATQNSYFLRWNLKSCQNLIGMWLSIVWWYPSTKQWLVANLWRTVRMPPTFTMVY